MDNKREEEDKENEENYKKFKAVYLWQRKLKQIYFLLKLGYSFIERIFFLF